MNATPIDASGWAAVVDISVRRRPVAVSSVAVRTHRCGRWTVVHVDGELDLQGVDRLGELTDIGTEHVAFELSAVTFIDASGLGLLLGVRRTALERGGTVRLVAPSAVVRRLLVLTGCSRTFPTFGTLDDAMSAPDGGP